MDSDTAKIADILINIKKSANSLVFLKTQVQETIVYGIDPSAKAILELTTQLKKTEDPEEGALQALNEIQRLLKVSQSYMAKMTSTQDLKYKTLFDQNGLGDSADQILETLSENYEGDFTNQETFEELVTARDGYQESFNDLADNFKTTKQNNLTISKLSYSATELVQQRVSSTEQQTLQLIDSLNQQGEQIIKQVSVEVIVALVILIILNLMIVDSITSPLSAMRKKIIQVAQNGDFSKWEKLPGDNELTDISESIRTLLVSIQSVVNEMNSVSEALSQGDLKAKVTGHYNGDLKELANGFNNSMVQVKDILRTIDVTSVKLSEGKLDVEIDLKQFKGDYHKVMKHLKNAINIQKSSIKEIIEVMSHMNEGDFSHRIMSQLPGEYHQLKDYLNESLDNLETAIDGSNKILYKYQNGDFSYRSKIQFKGRLNELKTNMDNVANNITQMLNKVKMASNDSLNGVSEISSGNQNLNERVQVQAASLQNNGDDHQHHYSLTEPI